MKKIKFAAIILVVSILLPQMTSCKSDENPLDINVTTESNAATIRLRLAVEDTRAGESSTTEENEIKNVTVHVFDANHKLEITKNVNVTSDNKTVNLEVSNGLKTIYVISAKSNVNPTVGITLENYENSIFTSTLDNLKTDNGFVMVGKSNEQQVMISGSGEELPASNVFDIRLTRLVAKAQVKTGSIDGSSFGISFGGASFKAIQTNDRMRVVHNGTDVFSSYIDSNNNGTYDNYSLRASNSYFSAVTTDYTSSGCEYMSENIVSNPVSGNTTFLSIRFSTTPEKYYTFNATNKTVEESSETPTASTTYYAVGIIDRSNGIVDYALHSNKIITFKAQEDADAFVNSLNNGESSTFTVSQTDNSFTSATRAESTNVRQFETVKFDSGYAYYRVNIAHKEQEGDRTVEKFKVIRNKYYKVNINSVNTLGFNSESLLRPGNPEAKLDAEGHSWIAASISVVDWDVIEQNVDL